MQPAATARRVVVTGIGVVSSCGIGRDAFWAGLSRPAHGAPRTVADFDASAVYANPKEVRRADRFAQFAMVAAAEAWAQSGLEAAQLDRTRAGVWVGTGVGGLHSIEEQHETLLDKGPRRVSPFLVPMMMSNANAAAISMRYGLQGPCENTVTACAAGTQSIGNAMRMIRDGRCDVVITGSSEAAETELAIAAFGNMTALSSTDTSRPFDTRRDGFVLGEGGAILVLESAAHAEARGAAILAEVTGAGSTADAHHITAPSPGGEGAIRCMRAALADAGLEPGDIAHINAHGTSTPLNDAAEADAVATLFGTPGPPLTSIKGVTGHSLGAAGAIEAVAAVLTIIHRELPPTVGLEELDPALPALDVVRSPQSWTPGPILSNSFGFGGHNGSIVIGPATA